jgi:3-methyladenine DNA glycosylase AlkD
VIKRTEAKLPLTASSFLKELEKLANTSHIPNILRFLKDPGKSNKVLGVRMGDVFKLAKVYSAMPLSEVDKLLKSDFYEARMGAVSLMDFQARAEKISDEERKSLFDLYIKRHERINDWGLVDRSAPHVVGGYLADKSRKILYKLAKSKNPWERRTSIVSTWYFIRQNDVSDTFKIAGILVEDKHELVQKAVGSWIREAGKRDRKALIAFLDDYAGLMPRVMLRYAIEKLEPKQKSFYMARGKKQIMPAD